MLRAGNIIKRLWAGRGILLYTCRRAAKFKGLLASKVILPGARLSVNHLKGRQIVQSWIAGGRRNLIIGFPLLLDPPAGIGSLIARPKLRKLMVSGTVSTYFLCSE